MFENVELKRIDIELINKYMPKFREKRAEEKGESTEDKTTEEEKTEEQPQEAGV
jgi:hypothetical protein